MLQSALLQSVEEAQVCHGGFVWGEGDASAKVAFIGEAPGATEVAEARPFVGKAGRNLDDFLTIIRYPRSAIYLTNAVKFRPVKQGKRGLVNRPPSTAEIAVCRDFLMDELALISPMLMVTLGNVSLRAVYGMDVSIGQVHGQAIKLGTSWGDVTLFPLYHPASVIYNRALMDLYQDDLEKLSNVIRSISCLA